VVSIDFSLDAANQIHLRYSVMIASGLRVELAVHNRSEHPFTFEEALHNYLAVSDVRNVSITGLESSEFIDKTDSMNRKTSPPHPLRLESETDRVYVNTTAWCRIYDSDWERRITLRKSNSSTTVVWNPWIETARKMTDLAAEEWKSMLCIETANAADNAITLNPGDEHRMALSITASPQSPSSPPP
jgi:glucose-6-phosphate 1-epimerase